MNKAILMGRLTKDPELRTTSSQIPVATFTLAVDRRFKNAEGERQADFISIVAWRSTAEFIGKYFRKGSKIVIVGSIQTRTYDDKEGRRIYVTEVVAEETYFAESKRDDAGESAYKPTGKDFSGSDSSPSLTSSADGFITLDDDDDTSLPFDL
jgi:single-strand DNA-binding protein